jgi:hypothetical protein
MQSKFKSICVFCGSSKGKNPLYLAGAAKLGEVFVEKQINLVYGGGNLGLMGETAKTILQAKGKVIGVIPEKIHAMIKHLGSLELTELHVVEDMHKRKALMYDLSDAFIIQPGGIGTIEEFFEIFTWYQLGYHQKPIGLLNTNKYFAKLKEFLEYMIAEGFLKKDFLDVLIIDTDPLSLITRMEKEQTPFLNKF